MNPESSSSPVEVQVVGTIAGSAGVNPLAPSQGQVEELIAAQAGVNPPLEQSDENQKSYENIEEFKEAFALFGVEHPDGKITKDELMVVFSGMGKKLKLDDITAMIQNIPGTGGTEITYPQFVRFITEKVKTLA